MKTFFFVLLAAASVSLYCACDDDDHDHGDSGGDHVSAFASCQAIIDACHEVDVGDPGSVHDCHETAHGATSDAPCAPVKDACVATCTAAKADAGTD